MMGLVGWRKALRPPADEVLVGAPGVGRDRFLVVGLAILERFVGLGAGLGGSLGGSLGLVAPPRPLEWRRRHRGVLAQRHYLTPLPLGAG